MNKATQIFVRNPRTGEDDYAFTVIERGLLQKRAANMRRAQASWSVLSLAERCTRMRRLADAIRAHQSEIAAALELDTGRRRITRAEVAGAAQSIERWIDLVPNLLPNGWTDGVSMPHIRHAPQFEPYDLVGVISPWNFPLTLSLIDAIPALLAGAAVIIKPSEVTPRFVDPMEAAIEQAGFADLISFARGAGDTGVDVIDVSDVICFTGSVPTGRKVAIACAERLIPAFLELGGKDPLIITASADLDAASDVALRGSILATGQACQSIERIYVENSVYNPFIDALVREAEAVRLNYPEIDKGEIGPIIFEKQADILKRHIDDAEQKGARVLTGGKIETLGGGLWLRPTVIADVDHSMLVMREESFGPIMPVMAFDDISEAVRLANHTEYGLSAAVFAGSLDEAEAIGKKINAGAVSLNDAALTGLFHEAEKQSFGASGLGPSRMGAAGFQRFFRRKALIANTAAPMKITDFSEDSDD